MDTVRTMVMMTMRLYIHKHTDISAVSINSVNDDLLPVLSEL